MTPSLLATFVFGTLIFALVPGPSVLFIIGRALALGRRAAVLTALGNLTGAVVLVVAVSIGVGPVLDRFASARFALKIIGALYLIWLGISAYRHRADLGVSSEPLTATRDSDWKVFRQGSFVGLTNPKALIFFAAVLPQFASTQGLHPSLQILLLGLLFCVMATTVDVGWAILAGTAQRWFVSSPARLRRVGGAGGLMLVGLGVGLLATGRPDSAAK